MLQARHSMRHRQGFTLYSAYSTYTRDIISQLSTNQLEIAIVLLDTYIHYIQTVHTYWSYLHTVTYSYLLLHNYLLLTQSFPSVTCLGSHVVSSWRRAGSAIETPRASFGSLSPRKVPAADLLKAYQRPSDSALLLRWTSRAELQALQFLFMFGMSRCELNHQSDSLISMIV
jgi:hypothetical protein